MIRLFEVTTFCQCQGIFPKDWLPKYVLYIIFLFLFIKLFCQNNSNFLNMV
jgi:uncharacterized membrane protein